LCVVLDLDRGLNLVCPELMSGGFLSSFVILSSLSYLYGGVLGVRAE
jgi:hypothetical protein